MRGRYYFLALLAGVGAGAAQHGSKADPFDILVIGGKGRQRTKVCETLCGDYVSPSEASIMPAFEWAEKWFRITLTPAIQDFSEDKVDSWKSEVQKLRPDGVHHILYFGILRPPAVDTYDIKLLNNFEKVLAMTDDENRLRVSIVVWRGNESDDTELARQARQKPQFERFFPEADPSFCSFEVVVGDTSIDQREKDRKAAMDVISRLLVSDPPPARYIPWKDAGRPTATAEEDGEGSQLTTGGEDGIPGTAVSPRTSGPATGDAISGSRETAAPPSEAEKPQRTRTGGDAALPSASRTGGDAALPSDSRTGSDAALPSDSSTGDGDDSNILVPGGDRGNGRELGAAAGASDGKVLDVVKSVCRAVGEKMHFGIIAVPVCFYCCYRCSPWTKPERSESRSLKQPEAATAPSPHDSEGQRSAPAAAPAPGASGRRKPQSGAVPNKQHDLNAKRRNSPHVKVDPDSHFAPDKLILGLTKSEWILILGMYAFALLVTVFAAWFGFNEGRCVMMPMAEWNALLETFAKTDERARANKEARRAHLGGVEGLRKLLRKRLHDRQQMQRSGALPLDRDAAGAEAAPGKGSSQKSGSATTKKVADSRVHLYEFDVDSLLEAGTVAHRRICGIYIPFRLWRGLTMGCGHGRKKEKAAAEPGSGAAAAVRFFCGRRGAK